MVRKVWEQMTQEYNWLWVNKGFCSVDFISKLKFTVSVYARCGFIKLAVTTRAAAAAGKKDCLQCQETKSETRRKTLADE